MEAERWQQACDLFLRTLERPEPARSVFLEQICADDPALRREVESLLAHDRQAESFLAEPACRIAAVPRQESRRIGPYKIIRRLGEGGMGIVYLATRDDAQFERRVAIKLLRSPLPDREVLRRFRHERQILAHLEHPNIARLYDGGTTEDKLPFLVMELVEGLPIDDHCRQHGLSIRQRLDLVREVCGAIQYAHQNLLVHRDIKPSNILVTTDGTPKLLDFGIAKLLDESTIPLGSDRTRTGQRLMTWRYASPEQMRGEPVTTASDVYALGVLLYELLVDRSPYGLAADRPHEVERMVREEEPQRPSLVAGLTPHLRQQLRGDLDTIVLKALRKTPQRRYGTAGQLARDLERHLLDLPVAARPDSLRYRTGKLLRRHRVAAAITAAFALLTIVLVGGFILTLSNQIARTERERDKAQQVSRFLIEMFAVSNPTEEVGQTVTARQLLDQSAQRIARELAGRPAVRAMLLDTTGQVYAQLGQISEAHALLQQALALRQQLLGPSHPEVAESALHLGVVLRDLGELDRAEPLLQEALRIHRDALPPFHPAVADNVEALALLHKARYELAKAEDLYREALALRRQDPDRPRAEIAKTMSALAIVLREKGGFEEAQTLFADALVIRRQLYGNHHPEVASSLQDLGNLHHALSDFRTAEAFHRRSVALSREVYGDEHPKVADRKNSLALALEKLGRYEEAERLMRESLATSRRLSATEHPDLAVVMGNLATLLTVQGKLDEAEKIFREALDIRLRLFGEGHPHVGLTRLTLGRLMHRKGDLEAAEALYRQADEVAARLPAGHRASAYPRVALSHLLIDKGEIEEAEALLYQALEQLEATHPEGHWRFAEARGFLGRCLALEGKHEQAETLLVGSYEVLASQLSASDVRAQRLLGWLVALYQDWGRPQQAATYQALLDEAAQPRHSQSP